MLRSHRCAIALLATLTPTLAAGPLAPPAGPVTPTMKTLEQVEPRTAVNAVNTPSDGVGLFAITRPGSYYLTGDIVLTGLPAGVTRGILISADDVTLDLNGFTVRATEAANPHTVISVVSSERVTVRNGSVLGGANSGVTFQGFGHAENLRISSEGLSGSGGAGLKINASGIATGCSVKGYTTGISSSGALVDSCTVSGASTGIGVSGALVCNCIIRATTGPGIAVYQDGAAFDNHVSACPTGIHLYVSGSRAYRNTVSSCASYGIRSETTTTMAFNNTVSGTPTPYVPGGSKWGPVVTDLASAVSPWANVSY
jgi:hypothetical protein